VGRGGKFSWLAIVAFALALLSSGCGADNGDSGAPFSDSRAERLTKRLRSGGNVLLVRHAATDRVDRSPGFDDCSGGGNLSARGLRQAKTIRNALRQLDVKVARVMTSPLCHAVETGSVITGLAFASRSLLPPALLKTVLKPSDGPDYSLGTQLSGYVGGPSNAVMVSHSETIVEATGQALGEGETLVIVPALFEDPEFRVAARLTPDDWAWLADR
jgi:phosphohistidine phosphatase SixA